MSVNTDNLVAAVRAYAEKHYNEDGWDVLVECISDDEIADEIGEAPSTVQAIRNVLRIRKEYADYRSDIQGA